MTGATGNFPAIAAWQVMMQFPLLQGEEGGWIFAPHCHLIVTAHRCRHDQGTVFVIDRNGLVGCTSSA